MSNTCPKCGNAYTETTRCEHPPMTAYVHAPVGRQRNNRRCFVFDPVTTEPVIDPVEEFLSRWNAIAFAALKAENKLVGGYHYRIKYEFAVGDDVQRFVVGQRTEKVGRYYEPTTGWIAIIPDGWMRYFETEAEALAAVIEAFNLMTPGLRLAQTVTPTPMDARAIQQNITLIEAYQQSVEECIPWLKRKYGVPAGYECFEHWCETSPEWIRLYELLADDGLLNSGYLQDEWLKHGKPVTFEAFLAAVFGTPEPVTTESALEVGQEFIIPMLVSGTGDVPYQEDEVDMRFKVSRIPDELHPRQQFLDVRLELIPESPVTTKKKPLTPAAQKQARYNAKVSAWKAELRNNGVLLPFNAPMSEWKEAAKAIGNNGAETPIPLTSMRLLRDGRVQTGGRHGVRQDGIVAAAHK